jgi:hypothetical protein
MKSIIKTQVNNLFWHKSHKASVFLLFIGIALTSCKKFLDIAPPKDAAPTEQVFQNDLIASSAMAGIYSRMASFGSYSGDQNSISSISSLSADEVTTKNVSLTGYYKNDIATSTSSISTLWSNSYTFIYSANAILEGLNLPNGLTEGTKKQLQGEAKFTRAFLYFYLTNLFGDVPLNLTSDYRVNEISTKASKDNIYAQITADLIDAENLLSSNYVTSERIRPNKWAAKALLSRVYLYQQKWDLAAQKATEVIDQNGIYSLVSDLDKVFLKNSSEAIWQLMPNDGFNTKEGTLFILTATPNFVSLSADFPRLFDVGDNRATKWIGQFTNATGTYYFPYKYKIKTTSAGAINEYSMVLRLAELYLIRAEARTKLSQTALALDDVNLIRKRAGLITPLVGLTPEQSLSEIVKQRRLELFTEWGHRWLDLKRTGLANSILAPLKGISWKDTDVLYPIPDSEITRNPNAIQNLGY